MINFSRPELQAQLATDQTLWSRVPPAGAAILWPASILFLGWGTGLWLGAVATIVLGAASIVLPPGLRVGLFLADLLDRTTRLPVGLLWLLVAWHLTVREPLFPLFDRPVLGAVVAASGLWATSLALSAASRMVVKFVSSRLSRDA